MKSKPNVNIAFSTDNFGVEMMLVALYSIMRHHNSDSFNVTVFVIQSGLDNDSKSKLANIITHFPNLKLHYLEVSDGRFEGYQLPQTRISQQAYYRYLLPELLPKESKILYLDIDILCRGSLLPLYNTDISKYHIAAVPSHSVENNIGKYSGFKSGIGMSDKETYFNSGVLLMNLNKIREDNKVEEFLFNADKNRVNLIEKQYDVFVDQTVANLTFLNSVKIVPYKWNTLAHSYEYMRQDPKIIHYAGMRKPFTYKDMHPTIVGYMDEYLDCYIECMALANRGDIEEKNNMIKQRLKDLYQQQLVSQDEKATKRHDSISKRILRMIGQKG